MIIKVCGLISNKAVDAMSGVGAQWVGLNFYAKSKRFISKDFIIENNKVKKVGVFVDPTINEIKKKFEFYNLDFIQLHGNENKAFCQKVQSFCPVIKVFHIDKDFDFSITHEFEFCDYFLFDTATFEFGGSGEKFNWEKLDDYKGSTQFLLAGGIDENDAISISEINHPQFLGIDINSKFEIEPGIKDPEKVKSFIGKINLKL
ncbi:MAG: phosphoribosylanthranilate isomerase [Saprospiraceae bacterium]|nr:phosphoribosylanthranilate isomerase [Saprospiraceae bacterium]